MTIFSTQADPQPMAFTEISTKLLDNGTFSEPDEQFEIDGICLCDFGCDFTEKVMATDRLETDSLYDYETSRSDFLFELNDTVTGSYSIYIVNQSTGSETLVTDNTYGELFDLGFNDRVIGQFGYLFNWTKIKDTLGYGRYKIRVDVTNNSIGNSYISRLFRLLPYRPDTFYRTVKIETVQNGVIENGTDYLYLNWNGSLQLRGQLSVLEDLEEEEYYPDFNWNQLQIQERKIERYRLELFQINYDVWKMLTKDRFMANTIKITDYTYGAFGPDAGFREVEVVKAVSSDFKTHPNARNGNFVFEFEGKNIGTLKRN